MKLFTENVYKTKHQIVKISVSASKFSLKESSDFMANIELLKS